MTRVDEKPAARMNDFDEIIKHVGQFGPWQRSITLWMSIVVAVGAAASLAYIFVGFKPNYRCHIPLCDLSNSYFVANTTKLPSYAFTTTSKTKNLKKGIECEYYAPFDTETTLTCSKYTNALQNASSASLDKRKKKCVKKIFDTTVVSSSVVTQYDLTCENELLGSILFGLFKVGVLLGSFFLGFVGDAYGRMPALVIGSAIALVCGISTIFAPNIALFIVATVGMGFGAVQLFCMPFLMALETVGPRYAVAMSILINIAWATGSMAVGLEAYMMRDWANLALMAYLPLAIGIAVYWFVPESPRWLLAVGRVEEAQRILKNAACSNGTRVPDHLVTRVEDDESRDTTEPPKTLRDTTMDGETPNDVAAPSESPAVGFRDMFSSRILRLRTLNLFWHWMNAELSFYGLSYASTDLFGDKHGNFIVASAVEILGVLLCVACVHSLGRKRLLAWGELCAGVTCILSVLLRLIEDNDGAVNPVAGRLSAMFAFFGKMAASSSFALVFLYTAELYPTAMRSTAVGTCATIGRIGGVSAYLIGLLKQLWAPAPTVVIGIWSLIAGVLAWALPETAGTPLPETLEEAKMIEARREGKAWHRFPRSFREFVTDPRYAE